MELFLLTSFTPLENSLLFALASYLLDTVKAAVCRSEYGNSMVLFTQGSGDRKDVP